MPADDVSDLKDVVDAINRLCETIKASDCEEVEEYEDCDAARSCDPCSAVCSAVCSPELVGPEQVRVGQVQALRAERCGPQHEAEACEPPSEMYYTASSDLSLLSDADSAEREEQEEREERADGVMAGHVAAMRERFESMTRTNTPCPDLLRCSSPSLDVFRNITPSPDRLG